MTESQAIPMGYAQPGVGHVHPGVGHVHPGVGHVHPGSGWAPAPYPQAYPQTYAQVYPQPAPDRFSLFLARMSARTPAWVAPAGIFACFVGAGAYVLATEPTDASAGDLPTCFLKLTTGFDCPGCGGTRAFWYMLHANLPAAARHHALFVFALPFLIYLYVAWAGEKAFGWRLPALRLSPRAIGLFLAAWGVFSLVRNLPWAPFTSLYI